MNYLQLCKKVAQECGTIAGVPRITTVAGAAGRVANLTNAVRDAWIDIQNERTDWLWMRLDFEKPLTIGQMEYAPADWALTDVGKWLGDTPSHYAMTIYEAGERGQESDLFQIDWPTFRRRYLFGEHDANRPTEWSITPQGKIAFGNKPDKAYIVRGEYRQKAQELTIDTDEPEMPEEYHLVIVAEAIRQLARSDEAWQVVAEKGQQYDARRNALVIDQTPSMTTL